MMRVSGAWSGKVRVDARAEGGRGGAAWFAAATFLGAFLLFLVQPMVAKYLLPRFGGGPAVWTTCVLFFQVVLLGGYAYAHLGVSRLSPRGQATTHVALLVAAVGAAVATVFATGRQPWAGAGGSAFVSDGSSGLTPLGQILGFLAVTVALPCFVLSATSPLLNAWFARGAPGDGSRAYRLYALSNAGSLLALLAYPLVIEPALPRHAQALLWTAGLAGFAVVCARCAWLARDAAGEARQDRTNAGDDGARTGVAARLMWLALPACAAVMLLATTDALTHDVAAMPLLWVLPLALYLLTFILAFDAPRWYRRPLVGAALPPAAAGVCVVLLGADAWLSVGGRVALLAGGMFVCCLACHGELARLRPPAREMTAFYLTVAAGGALGGALVAVAAPLVLDRYAELHLGLWASCALALVAPWVGSRDGRADDAGRDAARGLSIADGPGAPRLAAPLGFGELGRAAGRLGEGRGAARGPSGLVAMLGVAGLVVLGAVLWAARDPYPFAGGTPVGRWRDFYGAVTVYAAHRGDEERECVLFRHAGVTHGLQFTSERRRREATTYFGEKSGVAVALRAVSSRAISVGDAASRGVSRNVGVVGLGAGTLAAYGRRGERFRFYELSPTVARVARERFSFLRDSAAECEVVLGDGRLSLEHEPPRGFDLLVLDAFSGHAIPQHLLTAEAFALYRRHLAPGGVIAVNVTNRFVDIQPVVAQQAARGGWTAMLISTGKGDDFDAILEADWVLLTDDAEKISAFRRAGGVAPRADPSLRLWTDEYASLYPVLRLK